MNKQQEKDLRKVKHVRYRALQNKYRIPEWFETNHKSKAILPIVLVLEGFILLMAGLYSLYNDTISINTLAQNLTFVFLGLVVLLLGFLYRTLNLLLELKYWLIIEPKEHPKELPLEEKDS